MGESRGPNIMISFDVVIFTGYVTGTKSIKRVQKRDGLIEEYESYNTFKI